MIDCLIDLKIIIEELHKINNNEKLEVKKIEVMIRKVLKEFKQKRQKN